MGQKTTTVSSAPPPLFQSKFLCLSLLYLISSIFIAVYHSFISPTKCLFRSSPFDPIQSHQLFSYPASYGEHKYAIPTSRADCKSPVFFSDYWDVLTQFQDLVSKNSTTFSEVRGLRYVQGRKQSSVSFGGNFSIQERVSFFDQGDGSGGDIPCGFFKELPIDKSDRIEMEKSGGMVVVSAIFNDHDKIRQPKGLGSKTLDNVCFFMFVDDVTLKGLAYHKLIPRKTQQLTQIGVWRLVRVPTDDLYENPAMNGVIFKYLVHRLFLNAKFSIWVDAKMQLVVDPLLLIHALVVEKGVDMAISNHPFYVHTMEEAMATARWKKWWDVDGLKTQMETYCASGLEPWSHKKLPYTSDVPDTAIILRKHNSRSNIFSCLMFNELDAFNPRDQLAFAYVRDKMTPKINMNMFDVEVFEQIAVEYRHNLKHVAIDKASKAGPASSRTKTRRAKFDSSSVNGSCSKYLQEMWGESSHEEHAGFRL